MAGVIGVNTVDITPAFVDAAVLGEEFMSMCSLPDTVLNLYSVNSV